MLHTFDKQYELPGRKYFSQTAVPALFSKVKDEVQRELQDISNFALTTDMWSSVNVYMSLNTYMSLFRIQIIGNCSLHRT